MIPQNALAERVYAAYRAAFMDGCVDGPGPAAVALGLNAAMVEMIAGLVDHKGPDLTAGDLFEAHRFLRSFVSANGIELPAETMARLRS